MRLPPPDSDASAIATYVDSIVRECANDQRRRDWEVEAERGLNLYVGNHYTTPNVNDVVRIVLNRVQNAIISLMAIQGGDPPKVTFTPRESGEPAIYFLNTNLPAGQAIAQDIPSQAASAHAMGATPEPWTPDQPLPDADVELIKQRIEQEQAADRQAQSTVAQLDAAGMTAQAQAIAAQRVPPTPQDVLVEVCDRTAAEALQTVFDGLWEASDCQYTFVESC